MRPFARGARLSWHLALWCAAALALVGCDKARALFDKPAPATASAKPFDPGSFLDGYDRLRQLACEKKTAQFFMLVDRDAISKSALAHLEEKKKLTKAMEPLALRGVEEGLTEWEHDIDRGESGFICQWKQVEADRVWFIVTVERVSGKKSKLTFEEQYVARLDRRDWVLVGIEND